MKDLLKHTIACRIASCLAAFCLAFVSCTSTVDDGPQDSRAITFQAPQADTRAVVENGETLPADFRVWGWHGTDGTNTDNIFDATVVYKDAGWNYTDGVRYWKAGETYNFYAVYPVFPLPTGAGDTQTTSTVTADGTITVTNFDCSKTGADAVDLMTATATEITYTADQTPQPVAMKFSHLLSKVNIMATVEGGNVTVTDITFAGMATQGDYSSQAGWTTHATATGRFTSSEKVINATGVDLLGDLLLIPQTVNNQFKITVNYTLDGVVQTPKEITLPTSIAQWQAGQSYKYTLTFKGDNIIFTVNVAAWNHSTGGIITVE